MTPVPAHAVEIAHDVYRRIAPTKTHDSNDVDVILQRGYGLCSAYAFVCEALLIRAGFNASQAIMLSAEHSHAVVLLRTPDGEVILDPTADVVIPHALDTVLQNPALATGHPAPDERYQTRGYHHHASHAWYSRVARYYVTRGLEGPTAWHTVRRKAKPVRILWISWPTQVEGDLLAAAGRDPELEIVCGDVWRSAATTTLHYGRRSWDVDGIADFVQLTEKPDLIVIRYPFWLTEGDIPRFKEGLQGIPHVVWCSEQGPTRVWAEGTSAPFDNIAVTSRVDVRHFKARFPDKRIFYLPFGSVAYDAADLTPDESYRTDLMADGVAHYACEPDGGGHGVEKRESVETMIHPVAALNLHVSGPEMPPHSWRDVPWLRPEQIRAEWTAPSAPRIYSATKLYLGITWNWKVGGYGVKLGRALGCGVPTLFHQTEGIEEEFGERGQVIDWSASPVETRARVEYWLAHEDERRALGARGKAFADAHLDWAKNLKRLAKEVRGD